MKIIFPLMMTIGYQAENKTWFHPIGMDATILHVTAYAVEEFINRVLRRQAKTVNLSARLHLQKGLRLFRQRLLEGDDESRVSDSTISVVLKLVNVAHFDGDYQASKQHMEGLRKMVDLRGGLKAFKAHRSLLEMMRCLLTREIICGLKD